MVPARAANLIASRFGDEVRPGRETKLAGDASERVFTRLYLDGAAAPPSIVLMETAPVASGSVDPFLAVGEHLARAGVGVPEVFAADPGAGVYLLEDLGDLHLARAIEGAPDDRIGELYAGAIDELLKIHVEGSDPGGEIEPAPCFRLAFDEEKLLWELDFFLENAVEGLLGRSLSPAGRGEVREEFRWLSRALAAEPRVVSHRDYHSRNLMVQGGRVRVIDFQDARMGPHAYDLASLLRDSYVNLSEDLVEAMLARYLEGLACRTGADHDPARFREIFDWMSVQRNLKAVGTFAFQWRSRGRSGYLAYIGPTLARVRETLGRHVGLARMRRALGRLVPEVL